MTVLLNKAFTEAAKLPEKEQDAFAEFMLAEMDAEAEWNEAFASSQEELAMMAREALAEHRDGNTRPSSIPSFENERV